MSGDPLWVFWTYTESDPALMLFTAALHMWQMPIKPGQSVLELGCNESNFCERLVATDPTLKVTGVDARPCDHFAAGYGPEGWTFQQGSGFDASLFEADSFDWVFLIGALEHFGLGYYGDPGNEYGDVQTIETINRWLKPGGYCYFDVPCNPCDEQTPHFRTYAPESIQRRLLAYNRNPLKEVARG